MSLYDDLPRRVEVRAPATIANLGIGFDVLGMAFEQPFDTIYAERTETPGVLINDIRGDGGRLPRESAKNTAGIAAQAMLNALNIADQGVCLTIEKGLPLASGLGSSAASAAGGAVAVNALFGGRGDVGMVIAAAVEGEAVVSGRHVDNVAPAVIGGLVLVTGLEASQLFALPVPPTLWATICTPDVAVPTKEARAVLPREVSLATMVHQTGGLGLFIHALYRSDVALMGRAMMYDQVVEPAREHLIPGLGAVRVAAAERGALATVISGSGPTICSFTESKSAAERVMEGMFQVYYGMGIGFSAQVTRPAAAGTTWRVIA